MPVFWFLFSMTKIKKQSKRENTLYMQRSILLANTLSARDHYWTLRRQRENCCLFAFCWIILLLFMDVISCAISWPARIYDCVSILCWTLMSLNVKLPIRAWWIMTTVETLYSTIYYSKYLIELHIDKSTQYVVLWTHKRHSIPRPFGRAMECLLWVLQQKLIVL